MKRDSIYSMILISIMCMCVIVSIIASFDKVFTVDTRSNMIIVSLIIFVITGFVLVEVKNK